MAINLYIENGRMFSLTDLRESLPNSMAVETINRLTAAASNLLKKHKLGAISEADVRWMETELESIATKPNN